MSQVQKELKHAKKDSKGYNYNYSNLEEVITNSRDVLTSHGLAISQLVGETLDGKISLVTILMHESGQYIETKSSVPLIKAGQNDAQSMGACITYLRRYAYQSIIGQASEDSDADSGEKLIEKPVQNKASKPTEKQLTLLRNNFKKLTDSEIDSIKNGNITFEQAKEIISEVLNGKR